MNTAKKIISCMLSVLMLVTGLPVRAANVTLAKAQTAGLTNAVERAIAQSRFEDSYGSGVPTLQEIDRKAHVAVQHIKEMKPTIRASLEEIKTLLKNDAYKAALKEEIQALGKQTDKYLQNKDLDKYARKKDLAFATALYDSMANNWNGVSALKEVHFVLAEVFLLALSLFLLHALLIGGEDLFIDIVMYTGVGAGGLTIITGIILGIIALVGFTSFTTTYFSPEVGGLDCGTLKHRHPCRVKNPELVHKEFLADPFRAVEFFVTHDGTGDIRMIYLAGEEGASMLNDTVDIMLHTPAFNPEGEQYLTYAQKQLYTKTLYWQKLSKEEKIKYLHDFAEEVRK